MNFCLNIESPFKEFSFRLDNKGNWVARENNQIIYPTDKVFSDSDDIGLLQKPDMVVTIESIEFEILPDLGLELGNNKQLSYVVYGFREEYPNPPDLNQLKALLISGNDTSRNVLVLKTDGLFYLYSQNQIRFQIVEKDIIVQFEGFQPGNGYVGLKIVDDQLDNYVQNLFKKAVYYWKKNLEDHEMHEETEIIIRPKDQIPDILDLFRRLNEIKNNWPIISHKK